MHKLGNLLIVYIEEVGALTATLCTFAWSNCRCRKKAGIACFYKELHVAIATTDTRYENDVAEFGTLFFMITVILVPFYFDMFIVCN